MKVHDEVASFFAGNRSTAAAVEKFLFLFRYDTPHGENCHRKLVLDRTDTKASNLEDYSNKTARLGSACVVC